MSINWTISSGLTDYLEAVAAMEARVAAISEGEAAELVWLLEHPPLYTAGSSAKHGDLRDPSLLPVYSTGRGGKYTYHGPGQRVAYVLLDLRKRKKDIRSFVYYLEQWLIETLASFKIRGERRAGRVGIWIVQDDGTEEKIAAIGIRVRRWITYHGISLNVKPNLDNYRGIVPCGLSKHRITSLSNLGVSIPMDEVDAALQTQFEKTFGDTHTTIGSTGPFS